MAFGIERLAVAVKHLTTQVTDIGSALRDGFTETRNLVSEAITYTRTDLGTRIDDTRRINEANSRDVATIRRELAELHALIEGWRADSAEARSLQPAEPELFDNSPHAGENQPHHDLLAQAAGVANAELVCHRDTWAFLTERASQGEHFRMPVDITHTDSGTVQVELSGRSLIAISDALWQVTQTPGTPPGTHHLAAQAYNRIHGSLADSNTSQVGNVIRIVIDDRRPSEASSDGSRQRKLSPATDS